MEKPSILKKSEKLALNPKCKKIGKFYVLDSDYFDKLEVDTPNFLKDKGLVQDFDENFNSFTANWDRVVGFLDLYEEEFLSYDDGNKKLEEQKDLNEGLNVNSELHVLMSPVNNVSESHFQIGLYPNESIPQVIGSELIEEVLNIFTLVGISDVYPASNNFYIGYNSLCAGAEMNQMHIETLDLGKVKSLREIDDELKILPIERQTYKHILTTSLRKKDEAFRFFECGVEITICEGKMRTIRLAPTETDIDPIHIFKSMSFVAGLFISMFLASSIPHNLIASKQTNAIYLVPRNGKKENYGWLEVGGIPRLNLKKEVRNPESEIWEKCSIPLDKIRDIALNVAGSLNSKFESKMVIE